LARYPKLIASGPGYNIFMPDNGIVLSVPGTKNSVHPAKLIGKAIVFAHKFHTLINEDHHSSIKNNIQYVLIITLVPL
jgi:hypothetical protein